jgi:hypothetical protein
MLLTQCDHDQGSSGPVLFYQFVVAGGKNGKLYLMRTDKMAGYQPGPFPPSSASCMPGIPDCADGPDLIQQWQASTGHIHSAPVVWKAADNRTWLFIMGEADRLTFLLMAASSMLRR